MHRRRVFCYPPLHQTLELFFGLFCCLFASIILCCLGYSLPLGEILVFGFVLVLVPLYSAVSYLDSNSASTASASFGWLSLFPSRGKDRPALLCAPLAFVITLCGPLRGPGHFFDLFPTLYNYFSIVLVWFGSIVGSSPIFCL